MRPKEMCAVLDLLKDTPTLGSLAPEHLAFLAKQATLKDYLPGERVFEQSAPADACYMLLSGKVLLSFQPVASTGGESEGPPATLPLRQFEDPGRLLGWSAMVAPFRYRASVTALAPTKLAVFEKVILDSYIEAQPEFGINLLERIIWVLGNRLRETRIRLVAQRYQKEVTAIQTLLDQSAAQLRVDSPLHKIPYYLQNRLTIADAFRTLELVTAHGDQDEQNLASLALEILQHVRKELRLYQDLQQVYEIVASAPADMPAREIRKRCCKKFIKLFERLDCIIEGEEKLPDEPGHIFIMNHLFNHPDNTLPNRFQLTLDTHFVSSMLLLRKYGEAPVRVIRKSRRDEIGHQKYFDRLGYIYVYSGDVDEAPGEPQFTREERRRLFLDSAQNCLHTGQNLVICPEGTSVATEDSPVAFKAGAFRLAAHVKPEPLIVPIAVANFDKSITRTRLAAVVHEPFKLSQHVPYPVQDTALYEFIDNYQRQFTTFVREAVALTVAEPVT